MNVLFHIQNFNNSNVKNDRLLNVDHNHDFQLPKCITVDPNELLINQLSATTISCLSLNVSSLKKHFQTLQTEITDTFRSSGIGLCETKIDSNIKQLYNFASYNLITNNNQLNKGGLALYIKSNIPVTIKPKQTFIRNGIESILAELTTTNYIIVVGLIYKRSVDISTENFSVALEPLISSLDPRVKTYIIGDFDINLLDHNLSPPFENFINQMISTNSNPH